MFHENGHPDVSLSDWNEFRSELSPYLEEVIDRSQIKLPDRFLPLARGIAIPSPCLLGKAGYRPGSYRAPGWCKPHCDVLWKDIGPDSLIVRGYHGHPLWQVERNGLEGRPHGHPNMALVHIFSSTPILTRNYQSATYLAEFCFHNGPPPGLRWVAECPDDISGAIEFAQNRLINEALASCGFLSSVAAWSKVGRSTNRTSFLQHRALGHALPAQQGVAAPRLAMMRPCPR
jgi:hypothetical protein